MLIKWLEVCIFSRKMSGIFCRHLPLPKCPPLRDHGFSPSQSKILAMPIDEKDVVDYSCVSIISVLSTSYSRCFCSSRLTQLIVWLKYYSVLCRRMTNVRMLSFLSCQTVHLSVCLLLSPFLIFLSFTELMLSFRKRCFALLFASLVRNTVVLLFGWWHTATRPCLRIFHYVT